MTRPLTTTLPATRLPLRTAAYWAVTTVVVGEAAIGGAMDLLRMAPFYPLLIDLGYPGYLSTILGTAKVLAAVVIAAPRLPRLKEWAYAGMFFDLTGAAFSHASSGDPVAKIVTPLVLLAIVAASWALRPSDRKVAGAAVADAAPVPARVLRAA